MVSRLMLNLRIGPEEESKLSGPGFRSTVIRDRDISPKTPDAKKNFADTIIGNLGAGVSFWEDDEIEENSEEEIELTPRLPPHSQGLRQHPFAAGATPYYRDW